MDISECLPYEEVHDGGGDELEQRVEEGEQGRPEHVQPKTPHYIPGSQDNFRRKIRPYQPKTLSLRHK